MMLIIQPLFQFNGDSCDSLIDLGKVLTVEFTSAGTLTTLPLIDTNCPPLGSSGIFA